MVAFLILSCIFCCVKSNSWNIVSSITQEITVKAEYTLRQCPNNDQMLMIKVIDEYKTF